MAVITPSRTQGATPAASGTQFQGFSTLTAAYAATSTPTLVAADGSDLHVCYAQITGAMTINATVSGLLQFQRVCFHFFSDASIRVITFGTGFASSGTLSTVASRDATVWAVYDGTQLKITSREVAV